jgi:ribosomal protein S18 acetylase RimI-like enzyme
VIVRPALASDVPAILALYGELTEVHRQRHPELYDSAITSRDPAVLERELEHPHVSWLVAEATSGEVIGYTRLVHVTTPEGLPLRSRSFCLVDDLVVAPTHRRQGAASALLGAAQDWAKALKLESLEVTVWTFNESAQELYEKHGFGELRQYWRKPL